MYSRLSLLLLLLCLPLTRPVFASIDVNIAFAYHPFVYEDANQQMQGQVYQYLNKVAKAADWKLSWQPMPPLNRTKMLCEKGTVDILLMAVELPNWQWSKQHLKFSKHKLFTTQPVLAVKANSPLTQVSEPKDIADLEIGFIANMTPSPFVAANAREVRGIQGKLITFPERMLKMLMKDRIEAILLLNQNTITYKVEELQLQQDIRFVPLPEGPYDVNIGFCLGSDIGERLYKQYLYVLESGLVEPFKIAQPDQ